MDKKAVPSETTKMNRVSSFAFALLLCVAQVFLVREAEGKEFNVKTFGAMGDGTNLDTTAFQKALDACASAGGGTVTVPAGHYLIGSIVMRDHTTLHLDKEANLVGSSNADDYPLTKVRFEGEF